MWRWLQRLRRRKPQPGPTAAEIDAVMRDFARRYYAARPFACVGVKVPPGWTLQSFTAEALRRYPSSKECA